jgi:hypothetical protein
MLFPFRLALRRDTYGRDDFSPNGSHSAIVNPSPGWLKSYDFRDVRVASALPLKADIHRKVRHA